MQKENYLRRTFALIMAFLMIVSMMPLNVSAQDTGSGSLPGIGTYEANPDGTKNTGWPLGNIPLINMYSGIANTGTGSNNIKYVKTANDDQGREYIEFQISQTGQFAEEGTRNYNSLSTGSGYWSNFIIHFDQVLFDNLDLDRSYIIGENNSNGYQKRFNFSQRARGYNDRYSTDGQSVTVPFLSIFNVGSAFVRHEATLRLYTKETNNLIKGSNYLLEYRVGAQPKDRSGVYFRNYIYGIENPEVNQFEYPDYIKHTGSLNFPYGVEIKDPSYSSSQQDAMKNVHTEIYVDWEKGELHVNYLYENLQNLKDSKVQFVQILPKGLLDSLEPRWVGYQQVVAKFNHVYKRGDLNWGNDQGISLYRSDFTVGNKRSDQDGFDDDQNGSLAGLRLQRPDRDWEYTHPWTGIKATTTADDREKGGIRSVNISDERGRYYAKSSSHGALGNHIIYYINKDNFRKNFNNIDDLSFESFFVAKGDNEYQGAVLKNSESFGTPAYAKAITNPPQVDEIYDDAKEITGKTGYPNNNQNVFIEAKNYKDDPNKVKFTKDHIQGVNGDGSFNLIPGTFDGVFEDMEKDDKLTFETIYQYENHFKSAPTVKKVKSRIYFKDYEDDTQNPDKRIDKVVEVPASTLFRGQTGYKETGLGDKMPEAPVKKGYIFKGWATKPISAQDYTAQEDGNDKVTTLENINQWKDTKAYKFTKDSPINKSYAVYPVWEEESKTIKIVLHANDGTDRKEIVEINHGEPLPKLTDIKNLPKMQDQYGFIANGSFSTKAILPNAYETDDKSQNVTEKGIFGLREDAAGQKYTLVGWSTQADNANTKIESLFSNMGMLAVEGQGKARDYYLSKVATSGSLIGQASAGKLFEKITANANDEIHLYAAWKPYFDMTVTKKWYNTKDKKYDNANVKDILQALAHGGTIKVKDDQGGEIEIDPPAEDASLKRNVHVGLLYRTAVTEANNPTVTGAANYYIVEDSLKELKTDTSQVSWKLPAYNAYGKRLSYIAVEFKDKATGEQAFANFNQKWNNIWTDVGENLDEFGTWDNKNISKVQNVELNSKDGSGVDAFSGATVRILKENGIAIEEKQTNTSTVGTKPEYSTTLYNVETNLAYPNFRKIFDKDEEVRLLPTTDPDVKVVEFDLPSEPEPVIFQKQGDGTWKRVQLNGQGNAWEDYTGDSRYKNEYTFEVNEQGTNNESWVLKFNLEQFPKLSYKALKTGQVVRARYFGSNPTIVSKWSQQTVENELVTPTLNGLEQVRKETIGGKDYVVIRALKPTDDLGQFRDGATLTLIHDGKAKEDDLVPDEAYKDANGDNVTATESNGYYYFKVPVDNIKHDDIVGVHGHQDTYKDSRSTEPLKVDLAGPVITADNITVYRGEEINILPAVTTDEDAKMEKIETLPNGLNLKQKKNAELGKEWKIEGKADTNGKTTVKLTATDRFGNEGTKTDWIITVTDRPKSDAIDANKAKQIKNKVNADYTNIIHQIEVEDVKPGASIKVYLYNPATSALAAQVVAEVPENHTGKFIIDVPENVGKNISDHKLYLTQTEVDKTESDAIEVAMDVEAPDVPVITVKPGEKTITLSNVDTADTDKMYLNVAGKDYSLTKSTADGVWILEKPDGDKVNVNIENGNELVFNLGSDLKPNDKIKLTAVDKFINPASTIKTVDRFEKPSAPTVEARNVESDRTTVKGTSAYPGKTVNLYEVTSKTDPETQEVTKDYKLIGTVLVGDDGNYRIDLKGPDGKAYKPGTVIGASVVVNGVESDIAEDTVIVDSDIIPFDPDDPNKPDNPDKDKYVTVTLDANGGTFLPGTKSAFHVKKDRVLKAEDFEEARLRLQAPIDKTFDKWLIEENGNKVEYTERKFDADATIYASYKADGNIIPFDPDDPNKPDKPDKDKYVTVTLNANGGTFDKGTKSAFHVKKDYTLTTNDFAVAERGLKAPEGKAFTAWYLDKDGKTPFPAEGKQFTEDSSVFAVYKEDRDIIPVDDETKDPQEGYVRVTIEKDDKTVRFLNTEAKHYYDVKVASKVRYADVINVVRAVAQQGYKDLKWYEKAADNSLTLADNAKVITENVTLYAKAVNEKDIIPVEPGKEDETETPEGYVRVKLSHDYTVAFTDGVATSYDVNANGTVRYADVYNKVGAHAIDGYQDMKWYQGEKAVTGAEVVKTAVELTAKASNSKSIIPVEPGDEDDPTTIPEGYVRVKFVKDTGVSEIKGTKAYDIKADGSVRYKDLIDEVTKDQSKTSFTLEDGYRKPLIFKIGDADIVLSSYPGVNTEINVSATQKDANKYNPEGVIQDVMKDETPKAENSIGNKETLPEGTTYEFVDDQGNQTTPDTSTIGEKDVTVKVKYPDGSSETVDTKINIVPVDDIIDVTDPDTTPIPNGYIRVKFMDDETVAYGKDVTRACDIRESALATVKYSSLWARTTVNPAKDYRKPISWYLGQSTDAITVDRLVKDDVKADTKVLEITPKATQTDASKYNPKGQELKVTQGSTIEAKDFIKNKEDMPIGTKYDFVKENPNKPGEYIDDTPDTSKLGKQDLKIKVTFPDKSTKIVPAKMDVVPKDNIVKVDDPDHTPVPTGYVRVTLVNDKTSVETYKEVYDVKVEAKIKYGDVLLRAADPQPNDKYTTPITWKMNNNPVDKLGVIADTSTLTAFAKLKDSEAYEPEVQDQTVKQGQTPKAEDSISNKDKLPDGTKYEFVDPTTGNPTTPDTSKPGEQKPHIKVIYPDGSSEIVGPTTIKVVPDKDIIPVKPGDEDTTETPEGYVRVTLVNDQASVQAYKRSYDVRVDAKVAYGTIILGAPEPTPADKYTTPITWKMGGNALDQRAIVDKTSELTAFATAKVKPEVQDQTVKQGDTPDPADSIKNKDKLPEDTKYEFVNQDGTPNKPDTTKPGEQKPYVKVEYPDGTSEIVGPTTIKVVPDKDIIPVPDPDDENQKTPEGYVRVTLNHDDTVTFAANVVTTYDVKADGSLRYSDVCDQVKAQPAQGFADMKWYKDDRAITLTDKLTEKTAFELTAKAVHSDSIIPVKPGDENKPSPNGYVRVNLTKDDASVQFTATDAPTSYDVKADNTVSLVDVAAKVQAQANDGYKNLKWYKGDEEVRLTDKVSGNTAITLKAMAEKDITDSIIPVKPGDENEPSPNGYVRVTIQAGEGVETLTGITSYDVKSDMSVRYADLIAKISVKDIDQDKDIVATLRAEYQKPLTFKVDGNDVNTNDYPSRPTTMVVGATEKDSNKYTPEVQEQTVNQGDTPKAEDSISNKDKLPEGTKYEFVDDNGKPTTPDTNEPGEKDVKIKVTYPDGSEDTVDTKIKVEKNKPEKPDVEPIKEGDDTVKVKVPTDGDKVIVELPDGTKVEVTKDPTDPDKWTTPDENGDDKVVPVDNEGKLEIPVDPTKVKPGNKPVEVVVEDTTTGKKSDPTEVTIVAIPKELEQIKLAVENLYRGEKGISLSTNPVQAEILIYKDGAVVAKGYTDALGNATIILKTVMVKGERYKVVASKNGYLSNEITMTVK
ncbi:MAG: Rib/alpha-like domain-containing protein [Eubacteriales bacterium]|uniref:Rib/alpha-like domain-containing protein n=1 Tax=Fenollaria sp. TaxID=1965292 RepID=UPI002A74FC06|nr:Rib/alpha-like domain-containing protein [Fenollaria sp.]MDD7340051.1 Rib/alpha-like domain-containing protein [Eubacteriales bacterium]MDY3105981.1 Rib/alpha-like domain-containing protein [Fenollaria sp.]